MAHDPPQQGGPGTGKALTGPGIREGLLTFEEDDGEDTQEVRSRVPEGRTAAGSGDLEADRAGGQGTGAGHIDERADGRPLRSAG